MISFIYFFEALPNLTVKRSEVVRAVIVRTKKGIKRESGISIQFDENAVVIINADNSPKGSLCFLITKFASHLFYVFLICY